MVRVATLPLLQTHARTHTHTHTAHQVWGGLTKALLSPGGQGIPGARVKREFQARVRWESRLLAATDLVIGPEGLVLRLS